MSRLIAAPELITTAATDLANPGMSNTPDALSSTIMAAD